RVGDIAPGIENLARGATDIAASPILARQRRTQHAGADGAIEQRSLIVVEIDQGWKRARDLAEQPGNRPLPILVEIDRYAARHDTIAHQAMTERAVRRAQHAFAEYAAMSVHQGEGGVVADRTDIAEMVGEPLKLRHQSAQPHRARRWLEFESGFGGARKGIGIGDGAVAGNAAHEP